MKTDWNPLLKSEFHKTYWEQLQEFVRTERTEHTVYPPESDVFNALHATSHTDTRVVILGQDPYHGPGQAHGLAFSVKHGTKIPPSLRNIHKELFNDLGVVAPDHGNLSGWAKQGVLLLNTVLTVRAGEAGSHRSEGWERFTDKVIQVINNKDDQVVFVLWGRAAQAKKGMLDLDRHAVVESAHPSPLSAHNGFFGSKPFSKVNGLLVSGNETPINWAQFD